MRCAFAGDWRGMTDFSARAAEGVGPYGTAGNMVRIRRGSELRNDRNAGDGLPHRRARRFAMTMREKAHIRPGMAIHSVHSARVVEGADPYDASAYICIHKYTKYKHNRKPKHRHIPTQIQIQTQKHPQTQNHIHPHSQKESGTGLLKTLEAVENRRSAALADIGTKIGNCASSPEIGN